MDKGKTVSVKCSEVNCSNIGVTISLNQLDTCRVSSRILQLGGPDRLKVMLAKKCSTNGKDLRITNAIKLRVTEPNTV